MINCLSKYCPVGKTRPLKLYSVPAAIESFSDKNILFLQLQEFIANTHEKWATLFQEIKIFVDKNNIECILLDRTQEPEIINNKTPIAPSNLEMLEDLLTLIPSYILTEDYEYYYNPTPNIIFFPYQLWVFSTKNIHKYYFYKNTTYDTQLEKTKPMMCLNRNLQWHRMFLFSLIAGKSWFNKINYSFLNKIEDRLENPYAVKPFLTDEERNLIKFYEHLLPINLDDEPDTNKIPIMYHMGAGSVDNKVYANTAINLVTETSLTEGVVLSEKTSKPFMAYQIPIIIGPVGANKFLEDIGLDMFSDYIPWKTWDSETDHKLKIRKIVDFLDQLLSSPTAEQDILATHQSFHARLINNKECFHSTEFENILTKQLKF